MKKSLILVGLLISSISTMANDNSGKYYYGIGMASGSGTFTESMSEYSYDSSSMPIKFGMMLRNNNRFELSYEKEKYKFTKIGLDHKVSGWNLDWNFVYPRYKIADAVTPYWTLGLGVYTYEDTAKFIVKNEDLKGVAFNYGMGGLYNINKNIELEASYKFKGISWENYTMQGSGSGISIKLASTELLFYLGLNYKF
jgi:opacity protein-like surface antigen